MEITRRDFGKWLSLAGISLVIPKILIAEGLKTPVIESTNIITSFKLDTIFGIGQIQPYIIKDIEPYVELTLGYSDGSIKKFETNEKRWYAHHKNDKTKPKQFILSDDEKTFRVYIDYLYGGTFIKLTNLRKIIKDAE